MHRLKDLKDWQKSCERARGIGFGLRKELFVTSGLFNELANLKLDQYKVERDNTEEFIAEAGEVNIVDVDAYEALERNRNRIKDSIESVEKEIRRMVEKRVNGIRSEIPILRRRLRVKRRSKKYQQYERKVHDSNVYEVRQTLKNYERLVEKRLKIFKNQMKTGVEELRLAKEEEIRDAEMARKRCNVHNFTKLNLKSNVKTLLQKSGSFVIGENSKRKILDSRQMKSDVEGFLLKFLMKVTRQFCEKKKTFKGDNNKRRTKRQQIRYYLLHPDLFL